MRPQLGQRHSQLAVQLVVVFDVCLVTFIFLGGCCYAGQSSVFYVVLYYICVFYFFNLAFYVFKCV